MSSSFLLEKKKEKKSAKAQGKDVKYIINIKVYYIWFVDAFAVII